MFPRTGPSFDKLRMRSEEEPRRVGMPRMPTRVAPLRSGIGGSSPSMTAGGSGAFLSTVMGRLDRPIPMRKARRFLKAGLEAGARRDVIPAQAGIQNSCAIDSWIPDRPDGRRE